MARTGILGPDDIKTFESFIEEDSGDFKGLLESIAKTIADGLDAKRFNEDDVHSDLEIALWISYACLNIGDYEHCYTSCEWLSRVENQASGCGQWFYRYANSLMYCGKPRLALEYVLRGVSEEPAYPWNWLTLGRLRSHYGDRDGALAAAKKGLELMPADPEFGLLVRDIEEGTPLEVMEVRPDPADPAPQSVEFAFESNDPSLAAKAEAVMGIVVDTKALQEIKKVLGPSGWIADHPYCTFMKEGPRGQVMVTLAMDEAYLSKMPADRLRNIVGSIPGMEAAARKMLPPDRQNAPLYGLTIDRRLRPMLSFGDFENDPQTIPFDEDLQPIRPNYKGGPFVAFVLLSDENCDYEVIRKALSDDWGIPCRQSTENGSLVFEHGGDLVAYNLIKGQVPDGEAQENARNNYLWEGALDATEKHRSHLLVALVNHGESPIDAGILHTKLVAAACRLDNVVGVYFTGTVVSPESYLEEAEHIRKGTIPLLDWVWFGLYQSEEGCGGYTRGLTVFGKGELEVVNFEGDLQTVRDILVDVAFYLLQEDATLDPGDGISLPTGDVLTVTRSPGYSLDEETLKIGIPKGFHSQVN